MHALAAADEDGWAEVDANPNPLRERVFAPPVIDGCVSLSEAPGLGVEPDLQALAAYQVDF
jgi:L-alanine-DL-glutamate epimerase-like enolase superfamily enzyme